MATGKIEQLLTKKQYSVVATENSFVEPFKAFGSIATPIDDQSTYGGIVSIIPADSSAVAGIDLNNPRIMLSTLSAGTKTIIVIFSKAVPASP